MLALSSIYRRAFASATSEREQQQQQQQRAAGAGLGAEEVEIAVLGGQEAGPGGSRAERAVADADSPAVVIIEVCALETAPLVPAHVTVPVAVGAMPSPLATSGPLIKVARCRGTLMTATLAGFLCARWY